MNIYEWILINDLMIHDDTSFNCTCNLRLHCCLRLHLRLRLFLRLRLRCCLRLRLAFTCQVSFSPGGLVSLETAWICDFETLPVTSQLYTVNSLKTPREIAVMSSNESNQQQRAEACHALSASSLPPRAACYSSGFNGFQRWKPEFHRVQGLPRQTRLLWRGWHHFLSRAMTCGALPLKGGGAHVRTRTHVQAFVSQTHTCRILEARLWKPACTKTHFPQINMQEKWTLRLEMMMDVLSWTSKAALSSRGDDAPACHVQTWDQSHSFIGQFQRVSETLG